MNHLPISTSNLIGSYSPKTGPPLGSQHDRAREELLAIIDNFGTDLNRLFSKHKIDEDIIQMPKPKYQPPV